jgi:hypothetical protein
VSARAKPDRSKSKGVGFPITLNAARVAIPILDGLDDATAREGSD